MRAGPLSAALPPADNILQRKQKYLSAAAWGTPRSDSPGCRPRAPIIRDGMGLRAGLDGEGSLDFGKISGEKFRNF